jgi:hypothetical protein
LNNTIFSGNHVNFANLPTRGYNVKTVAKRDKEENYPPVRKIISFFREKKLLGSLSCACSTEDYFNLYLNECCFKFNGRKKPETLFDVLLINAINSKPITNKDFITKNKKNHT